jgi:hypothetical protein
MKLCKKCTIINKILNFLKIGIVMTCSGNCNQVRNGDCDGSHHATKETE